MMQYLAGQYADTCTDNIGNLFSAVILDLCTTYITDASDTNQYRIPLYIMCALPFILSIGIFTMLVESPAWLVMKNRLPQALQALKKFYPYMSVDELELELAKLQYTVEKESEEREMVSFEPLPLVCTRILTLFSRPGSPNGLTVSMG